MVQEQLVDYISSQMKLGVARDTIKSALISAGWLAADVEDTLKKIEGNKPAQPVAQPAQPAARGAAFPGLSQSSSSSPQTIKVSDLVSASAASSPMASRTSAAPVDLSKFDGKVKGNTFEAVKPAATSGGGKTIMMIVGGLLILGLGGLSYYFYSQESGLASQVATLNNQSGGVNNQLAALQAQMNASTTALAAEISSLTAANADLALNLSFFAVPIGTSTSTAATPLPVTISGSLSGGKQYAITTPRGAKILIANSADAKISAELKPLVGQTVKLEGTYVEGSDQITVNSVTNISAPAPAPAAPAAGTSTKSMASTTSMTASSTATSSAQ